MNRMRLWEMLLRAVKDVEDGPDEPGIWPSDIRRVRFIKINPRYYSELLVEEKKMVEENDMPPYIRLEKRDGEFVNTFFGTPLHVDRKVEKWEVIY